MLVWSADHTANSGSTSAEQKHGLGGRTATACPPISNRTLTTAQGTAFMAAGSHYGGRGILTRAAPFARGRGESGPAWRAFPFSAAENLFGAMGTASSQEEEKEQQEGMG